MASPIQDMQKALTELRHPTVTTWNRLEGRPRTHDFDRALRAEVRDAGWMLARQWQLGEFRGEDAGSPATAKVLVEAEPLRRYQAGDHATGAFPSDLPLEAVVERRDPVFTLQGKDVALDLRMAMGRRWLRLLRKNGLGGYADDYVTAYGFDAPDPALRSDAHISAHPRVWQRFAAAAGRHMDGAKLYRYLAADPAHTAHDEVAAVTPGDQAAVAMLGTQLVDWVRRWIEPAAAPDEDAWQPQQLEYRCAVETGVAGSGGRLEAREYHHGRLDWYSFDHGESSVTPPATAPVTGTPVSFIPTGVEFDGMPHPRWWQFEDGRTDFGSVAPSTTDLARLLFIQFGLIYANDWFLLPTTVQAGSVARVRGLTVTNIFGERFWIEPAGTQSTESWQRWSMFGSTPFAGPSAKARSELLVLPTVPKLQESQDAEAVMLIRDEMANQVWGIERRVRLPSGELERGAEAAAQTLELHRRLVQGPTPPPPLADAQAALRYRVMTTVPEHWIPFIPVHEESSSRQIRLQRAAMLRIIPGDPARPAKVRPRAAVLSTGLDEAEAYFIAEEEVPRSGVTVTDSFQRTRWYGGKVVLWRGMRKQSGRGEASSGLAFDQLIPAKKATVETPIPSVAAGHAPIVLTQPPFPSATLQATADPAGGWNLHTTLDNFTLAPQNVSTAPAPGEGHMHLQVNGIKLTRVYSEHFHLPDLPPGTHTLRMELSANNHKALSVEGSAVSGSTVIAQAPPMAPGPPGAPVAWDGPAPALMLMLMKDPASGTNVMAQLDGATLAPEHASGAHVPGEGHLQLLIDGVRFSRMYGLWHYLPKLAVGEYEVTVRLVTNDHRLYTTSGNPIAASRTLTIEADDPTGQPHSH